MAAIGTAREGKMMEGKIMEKWQGSRFRVQVRG